jgi:peptidoglycan hydrolase-like protein with peptidoglycan-binding domain
VGAWLVVVATAVLLVVADPFGGGAHASGGVVDNAYPTGVASVSRQSLSSQTQVSATLGFADPSTINEPGGTAPSDVAAARQAVVADGDGVKAAQAALATDDGALSQQRASLAAATAKQAVDCAGANAAESASAPAGAATGGGSSSGACAGDVQAVSAGDQGLSAASAKVTGDQSLLSSARQKLEADQSSLSAAESSSASYGQSSTFTTLPAVGQVVRRGQSLYAVESAPVILLYGAVAPWRAFTAGMSPGRDVAELNGNLRVLGYGKGLSGDTFRAATTAAIRAFQSAHGLSPSGELPLGSVVFEAGAVRVTAVTPTLGSTVQAGPVLTITSTVRRVTIELDAAQQADVKVGDPALITLPDNSTTPGRISYVGTVATVPSSSSSSGQGGGGGSGAPTIEVDVTPTDPGATGQLDQAPVNVSITTARVANALVVPVDALLALSSGGYALEEIRAGGVHQLVAVDVGLFDDAVGLVQVTGSGLAAGQRIVVPGE